VKKHLDRSDWQTTKYAKPTTSLLRNSQRK